MNLKRAHRTHRIHRSRSAAPSLHGPGVFIRKIIISNLKSLFSPSSLVLSSLFFFRVFCVFCGLKINKEQDT